MLLGPKLSSRAHKAQQWIVHDGMFRRFSTPVCVPGQQIAVVLWQIGPCWRGLGIFPVRVFGITFAEQAPSSFSCFVEHSVSSRIRRAIRYAMLYNVYVHTWPKCSGYRL